MLQIACMLQLHCNYAIPSVHVTDFAKRDYILHFYMSMLQRCVFLQWYTP